MTQASWCFICSRYGPCYHTRKQWAWSAIQEAAQSPQEAPRSPQEAAQEPQRAARSPQEAQEPQRAAKRTPRDRETAKQAAEARALQAARDKARRVIRISPSLFTAIEHALEARDRQRERMLDIRTMFIATESVAQKSYVRHASFFCNHMIEELYRDTDFFFLEQIPCSMNDWGHRIESEEYE